jgi:energy-coupling factor transport system ATP-binding protein
VAILAVQDLTFSYPEADAPALDAVSLDVGAGEFLVLCGKSGSGKSTLLRHLKTALTPHGTRTGAVAFHGRPLAECGLREQASGIGFVLQNPDNQLVTDKVWHELAFGLESLGCRTGEIRRRVAEMASFFGIQGWYHRSVLELSGGQKQILNLASVMVMQPEVLVLDEPTAQLDPIAASDFLTTLKKVNQELGTTVLLSEHRLEDAFPLAGRVAVLARGRVVALGTPVQVGVRLHADADPMFAACPAPMRLALRLDGGGDTGRGVGAGPGRSDDSGHMAVGDLDGVEVGDVESGAVPVTVRDGRIWLSKRVGRRSDGASGGVPAEIRARTVELGASSERAAGLSANPKSRADKARAVPDAECAIAAKEVWFRYGREAPDVVRGLSLRIERGRTFALVGGNGTGKTTVLNLVSGQLKPYRGKVTFPSVNAGGKARGRLKPARGRSSPDANGTGARPSAARLAVLPQDPTTLFTHKTVAENLAAACGSATADRRAEVARIAELVEVAAFGERHPFDLSCGEQQRVALAQVLLTEPGILLLDEPTKGLDSFFKDKLGEILRRLNAEGVTVVLVSHDIEFCARHADDCALLFDGDVVASGPAREFFAGNSFFTTAVNRMARHLFPHAVTLEELIAECR